MNSCFIYLSGAMSNVSHREQTNWRYEVNKRLVEAEEEYGYRYKPDTFNPMIYYNQFDNVHKTNREYFDFDLYNLRRADLVIVNFNDPNSIGTAMELALAHEYRIPVVALNEGGKKLHPWLVECTNRVCDTMDELIEHVALYFLN